jgi:hypothetical protein
MMFAVLNEGEVSRGRFLQIGEKHGYNHRGRPASTSNSLSPGLTTRRDSRLADASVSGSSESVTRRERIVATVSPMRHPHDTSQAFERRRHSPVLRDRFQRGIDQQSGTH